MPARVIVFGMVFIIIMFLLVFTIELFLPLSVKADMNSLCRSEMLRMELEGGLSNHSKSELQSVLTLKGFNNVTVTGTSDAKQGEEINLHVEADYVYSKLTGFLTRADVVQHMTYNKTSVARRVVN